VDGDDDGSRAEARIRDGPSLYKHVIVSATQKFRVETDPAVAVRKQAPDEPDAEESTMPPGAMQILPYHVVRPFVRDGSMEAR
jgi:hypothetical protein